MVLAAVPLVLIFVGLSPATVAAAPTCDGRPATIVGTNGDDVIVGTIGADVIVGKGGRDAIDGRGGRDRICGGGGRDAIDAGSGNDRVFGGGGNDSASGGPGDDDLFGFTGEDRLKGGRGNDLLVGGADDDILRGGGGRDRLFGDAGSDGLDGGPASDECDQGTGLGLELDCETADLSVDVQAPSNAAKGPVQFAVDVLNEGPDGVTYTLEIDERDSGGTGGCEVANEGVPVPQSHLAAGAHDIHLFTLECPPGPGAGGSNTVSAIAKPHFGTDPDGGDDSDERVIVWD